MGKYFGTDGIRGKAFEKMNASLAYGLGQAIARELKPNQVVIGMDTRLSSPMLAYSLANGLLALGVDIAFAGVVSTPMIANYSKNHEMIGVMITASHNPYTDNGIKVFNKGYKTTEDVELRLETVMDSGLLHATTFGHLTYTNAVKEEYLKIYDQLDLKPLSLNIGFDSANGANYLISREIFNRINPQAIQIGNTPDGLNINRGCGSTDLESILTLVRHKNLDIAFSFDGDGDRIILIGPDGDIYDGDMIIYIIAKYLKSKQLLSHETVVLTKMSNPGILKALSDHNIHYVLTDVGDKYVFDALDKGGFTIGGESSGHVILTHLLHSGDGLLVAIYLLKILEELNMSLTDLVSDVQLYPYMLVNIKDVDKSVLTKASMIEFLNDIKAELGEHALLLVRPSGTESLIRVTISHKDEKLVKTLTDKIVQKIKTEAKL